MKSMEMSDQTLELEEVAKGMVVKKSHIYFADQ